MPALPCDHAWRPWFGPAATGELADWETHRICDACEAVAKVQGPYHEIVDVADAKRLRLQAAYLKPDAERTNN